MERKKEGEMDPVDCLDHTSLSLSLFLAPLGAFIRARDWLEKRGKLHTNSFFSLGLVISDLELFGHAICLNAIA